MQIARWYQNRFENSSGTNDTSSHTKIKLNHHVIVIICSRRVKTSCHYRFHSIAEQRVISSRFFFFLFFASAVDLLACLTACLLRFGHIFFVVLIRNCWIFAMRRARDSELRIQSLLHVNENWWCITNITTACCANECVCVCMNASNYAKMQVYISKKIVIATHRNIYVYLIQDARVFFLFIYYFIISSKFFSFFFID